MPNSLQQFGVCVSGYLKYLCHGEGRVTGPALVQRGVEQAGVSLPRPAIFPLLPEEILLKGEFGHVVSHKRRKQILYTTLHWNTD